MTFALKSKVIYPFVSYPVFREKYFFSEKDCYLLSSIEFLFLLVFLLFCVALDT